MHRAGRALGPHARHRRSAHVPADRADTSARPRRRHRLAGVPAGFGACPSAEVVGIDVSAANIQAALRSGLAARRRPAIAFRGGGLPDASHADPFDAIVTDGVLHLIPGDTRALFAKLAHDRASRGRAHLRHAVRLRLQSAFDDGPARPRAVRSAWLRRADPSSRAPAPRPRDGRCRLRERVDYMYLAPERVMRRELMARSPTRACIAWPPIRCQHEPVAAQTQRHRVRRDGHVTADRSLGPDVRRSGMTRGRARVPPQHAAASDDDAARERGRAVADGARVPGDADRRAEPADARPQPRVSAAGRIRVSGSRRGWRRSASGFSGAPVRRRCSASASSLMVASIGRRTIDSPPAWPPRCFSRSTAIFSAASGTRARISRRSSSSRPRWPRICSAASSRAALVRVLAAPASASPCCVTATRSGSG